MYACDQAFYDYNNGHVCKHIHRVHLITATQLQMKQQVTDIADSMDLSSPLFQDDAIHKDDNPNITFTTPSARNPHAGL